MTRPIRIRSGLVAAGRVPLVCTPMVGRTRAELLVELAAISAKRPDLIEWRADFFADIAQRERVLDMAAAIRAAAGTDAGSIPIIFTIRSQREGGEAVSLSDAEVAALNVAVCEARSVEMIDCEMSNEPRHIQQVRAAARASNTQLILSYHNFRETPDGDAIYAQFQQARELGGDIAKVAVMPKCPGDVLTLLGATLRAHQSLELPLIGISMGAYGALTRLCGHVFGSSVTFAVGQGSSAPGQISIEELHTALDILQRALAGKSI